MSARRSSQQGSASKLIEICDERLATRQHPLHARKIPQKSGIEENVKNVIHRACPANES
jgi:hypothetical protein